MSDTASGEHFETVSKARQALERAGGVAEVDLVRRLDALEAHLQRQHEEVQALVQRVELQAKTQLEQERDERQAAEQVFVRQISNLQQALARTTLPATTVAGNGSRHFVSHHSAAPLHSTTPRTLDCPTDIFVVDVPAKHLGLTHQSQVALLYVCDKGNHRVQRFALSMDDCSPLRSADLHGLYFADLIIGIFARSTRSSHCCRRERQW
eukprot:TRINITY_DN9904_c0_g1_i1.p1 TRINITY_DN9904_c0_g1~~TRINITY_DN9904_c0_g1_i1.p1  ORF type:complete len:220 (+),score=25.62 TRINITY_DN9904_c0_g1_i1:34-660(+)